MAIAQQSRSGPSAKPGERDDRHTVSVFEAAPGSLPDRFARAATRTAVGSAEKSPFVRITHGRKVRVKLDRKVRYELDGGERKKVKPFKVDIEPGAITVCVPRVAGNGRGAG